MMPSSIKKICQNIDADASKMCAVLYKKAEKALGVPVERDYCLIIDENGKYEIFDWPDGSDDPVTIDKGRLSKDERK